MSTYIPSPPLPIPAVIITPANIVTNPADPIVFGSFESDVIDGSGGAEIFHGYLINEDKPDVSDLLLGNGGDDQLFGDGGNDALYGGSGNDLIEGGFGSDGGRQPNSNVFIAYNSLDYRTGLFGGVGNDTIYGGKGDDALFGENDNDTLFGQDDLDWLDGGAGNDVLNGGNGNDVLLGQDGADVLSGDNDDDHLNGGAGTDSLFGGAGVDRLFGGTESDTLVGGEERDYLYGEDGNDLLIGGLGVDVLDGGAGADHYRFDTKEGFGDAIHNFESSDTIEIARTATKLGVKFKKGVLAAKFLDVGSDNHAHDANDFFIFRTTDKTLWFDKDGNAAAFAPILVTDLDNNYIMKASDILII